MSLYLASKNGRDQEVLSLLQSGYSPNSDYDSLPHTFQTRPVHTREHGRETPLHMACAYNHFRSAELLIKFGAIVAATDNIGWTPLHWASANNSEATAKLLLQHHCPTDITDKDGHTAADLARRNGHYALADYVEAFQPGPRGPLPLYPTLEQLSKLDCDSPALRLGARILNVGDCFENFRSRPRTTGYYLSTETLRIAKIKNIDMQWKDIVEGLLGIRERGLVYTVLQEYSYSGEGDSIMSVGAFYGWSQSDIQDPPLPGEN
ncbi:poly [ADP-ribose] polymerase tankyrase-1-like [Halichondria panicea]|uniref:poly [ADP-ribose] polymerase tankyrase-1-like n=1 Tax=Halichondria panicea TaxID=6063 RepID=UPI00312BC156